MVKESIRRQNDGNQESWKNKIGRVGLSITCPAEITEMGKREKEEKGTCPTHFMRLLTY